MSEITRELAKFAVETKWGDLPASIIDETKQVLMEHLGVTLASLSTDKGKIMAAMGRRFGGPPEASIIGLGDKVSCSSAALANGEMMICLDYHDIIAGGHDGLFVIPPALAIAESTGASGKDLILATALGLEISTRLARAAGWHMITPEEVRRQKGTNPPTGKNAHSNYGATAGVGRLLGLNPEKMANALGIAGHYICSSVAAGEREMSQRGMTKYVVPGWQNTAAVAGALMAEMGYTGDTTILDRTERLKWNPEVITEDLGKTWIYNYQLHYKPYPTCGAFQKDLDCFYNIIEENKIMPDEIESVKVIGAANIMGQGLPPSSLESLYSAQFNVPYNMSLLAHRVRRGVEWADPDTKKNPEILKFMSKVTAQADPEYLKEVEKHREQDPKTRPAKVKVMARGKTFTNEILYRRGDTFTDVSWTQEDAVGKFKHNAERILTKGKIERATKLLLGLEKLDNVSKLMHEITL